MISYYLSLRIKVNIMKNITSLTGGALIDNHNLILDESKLLNKPKLSIYDLFKKILFVSII